MSLTFGIFPMIFFDQITKSYVIEHLKTVPEFTIKVSEFVNIVYVWNYGIGFGLFKEYYQYSNAFFSILNILILLYLFILFFRAISAYDILGYSCVIAGAIGNIIDRCYKGAVFDFVDIHYMEYHFAVFNIADTIITAGAILLVYKMVVEKYALHKR